MKKLDIIVLVLYTLLNLIIIVPLISGDLLIALALKENTHGLLAIFFGLFLNAALILWVSNKNR